MDPISNTDRLVRLLREKLEERSKTKGPSKASTAGRVLPRPPDAVRAVTAGLARAGVEERQLRRSLVEQLLADQFDPALINEPKFQQIVDRVTEIMSEDAAIAGLFEKVTAELRATG